MRVLLAIVCTSALLLFSGCGEELQGAGGAEKIEQAVHTQCNNELQALTDVVNGNKGQTSGYILVCRSGEVVYVDD